MSAFSSWPEAEKSLSPVYPFNAPGAPIALYEGPMGESEKPDVPGAVQCDRSPKPGISWRLHAEKHGSFLLDTAKLHLRDRGIELPVISTSSISGWSNGISYGDLTAALSRVVAHWFNLPRWRGSAHLACHVSEGVPQRVSAGRSVYRVDGWTITLDVRPDHKTVMSEACRTAVYVMTHVMEIRRMNGIPFTADEVKPVLSALHMGLSFALGRWVAPRPARGPERSGEGCVGRVGADALRPATQH